MKLQVFKVDALVMEKKLSNRITPETAWRGSKYFKAILDLYNFAK